MSAPELYEDLQDGDFSTSDPATAAKVIRLARRFRDQMRLPSDVNEVRALQDELRVVRGNGTAAGNIELVRRFIEGDDITQDDRARVHFVVTKWAHTWAAERIDAWRIADRKSGYDDDSSPIIPTLEHLTEDNSEKSFLDRAAMLLAAVNAEANECAAGWERIRADRAQSRRGIRAALADPFLGPVIEVLMATEASRPDDPARAMNIPLLQAIHVGLMASSDVDIHFLTSNWYWLFESFADLRGLTFNKQPDQHGMLHLIPNQDYKPQINLTIDRSEQP